MDVNELVVTTRTIEQKGIVLPWEKVFNNWIEVPAGTVGTVEVFIPLSTLEELAEQGVYDSQFGSAFLLGYQEGKALEQAGLADRETRGGYHRTDKLLELMERLEEQGVL